jgi:hypothetical protein
VDFSKLKIELYDFFGILIPGMILISDCAVGVVGWSSYVSIVAGLTGNFIAISLALSYVAGHLVQEAGDILVHLVAPARYLKKARDSFWAAEEGRNVREAIKQEARFEIDSVDVAYDYCLSKVKGTFVKRDTFVATSDLARSLIFLISLTAIAAMLTIWRVNIRGWHLGIGLAAIMAFCSAGVCVAWRRMMRFRAFSDLPVFSAYLAAVTDRDHDARLTSLTSN